MAFGTKQVWYSGQAASLLPTGHGENTSPASIGAIEIQEQRITFNPACDAIDNANKVTAIAALTAAVIVLVDAYIGTTMGVDTTGNTVDYNCEIFNLSRGLEDNDILYDAPTDVYVIKVKITVSIS